MKSDIITEFFGASAGFSLAICDCLMRTIPSFTLGSGVQQVTQGSQDEFDFVQCPVLICLCHSFWSASYRPFFILFFMFHELCWTRFASWGLALLVSISEAVLFLQAQCNGQIGRGICEFQNRSKFDARSIGQK